MQPQDLKCYQITYDKWLKLQTFVHASMRTGPKKLSLVESDIVVPGTARKSAANFAVRRFQTEALDLEN